MLPVPFGISPKDHFQEGDQPPPFTLLPSVPAVARAAAMGFGVAFACLYTQAETGMLTDCKTYSLLFLYRISTLSSIKLYLSRTPALSVPL